MVGGDGAVYGYGVSFVLGVSGNYFLHGFLQPVGKNPRGNRGDGENSGPDSPAHRNAGLEGGVTTGQQSHGQDAHATETEPRVLELAMAAERYLALGDKDRAMESVHSVTAHMNAPLLKSYVKGLNERISGMEGNPVTQEGRELCDLLELMEDSFMSWDLRSFFGARDRIKEKRYPVTEEQQVLLAIWDEIISVMEGALEPTPAIADKRAERLGDTGRALISRGGLFLPYHEKILFRFLWSYWARREAKSFFPFRIAEYEPLLERILRKYPALPMDIDALSDIVEKYVGGHDRGPVLEFLVHHGMFDIQASLLLHEIDVYTKFDPALIDKAEGPNNNRGGDPLETSGMHAVGGRKSEEDRRIFQQIKGTEATVDVRRQWSNEIGDRASRYRERRRAIQSLGLGDSLNQLRDLLSMENPSIKMRDKDIPVHFQLLPGSWKQVSPGSPRADWYTRVSATLTIESVEIILHPDDIAAVVHEGLEVVLSFLPNNERLEGKPHTYAFLAEMLANDIGDDLVPQRALEEVDHKSLEELDNFLKGSANSRDEIESFFGDSSLFVARKRLLEIQEKLEMRAKEMVNERKLDPLPLFRRQAVQAERSIAVGDRGQAQQDLKDLDRFLYHLERTQGPHPLLSGLAAELHKRFKEIIEISEKMSDLDLVNARDFAEHLNKLKVQFVSRDFKGLLYSFGRIESWTSGTLYPDQKELADFWKDIEAVFRLLFTDNNWNESDRKVQGLESRWRDKLGRLGRGHMYGEGLLNGFLEAYWAQRERGNDWSHYLPPQKDESKHRIAFLPRFMEVFPKAFTSPGELSAISSVIARILALRPVHRQEAGSPFGSRNQKGILLTDLAVFFPGILGSVFLIGWGVVKGFTDPSFVLPSLFVATAVGLVMVGLIGVVLIDVFTRINGSLGRKKAVAQGFAGILKNAQEGDLSAQSALSLDVGGKDMVRAISSEKGFWMGRYLKEALVTMGVAPLSFAAARALVAVKLWGAQVLDVSSAGMPEGRGVRPLIVVYLDKGMVAEGVSALVERYSSMGGALVLVPTDKEARTAVLNLPATFEGLIFDGGEGPGAYVPGLAVVERRLERVGVKFDQYTGCRVVTPVGMALDAEGVRSALFREALIVLLNGLTDILIKREDLRYIDRAARAVGSAA